MLLDAYNIKSCFYLMISIIFCVISMILEWNNVGMLDDTFMVFCEGLGSSTSLTSLDLRNNQISHNCASELATALKRNTTLRSLGKLYFEFIWYEKKYISHIVIPRR